MSHKTYDVKIKWTFPSWFRTLIDFILVLATGGLWLLWMIVRYLRRV